LSPPALAVTIGNKQHAFHFDTKVWRIFDEQLAALIGQNEGTLTMSIIDELDIVIRHKSGKVTAGIPQLGVYAKADDVHAAITALEQKRAAFLADLSEAGGLDDLEVRHYNVGSTPERRRSELGQFTLKALIIIGLITGAFILWAALLVPRIERVIENTEAKMQQYTKVGGAQFWAKVEDELERAADPAHDIPPEKKRKLLSQIQVLVERWRPFMAEIAPLFADFQRPPSVEGPQGAK
jgi:hypothetical protein